MERLKSSGSTRFAHLRFFGRNNAFRAGKIRPMPATAPKDNKNEALRTYSGCRKSSRIAPKARAVSIS